MNYLKLRYTRTQQVFFASFPSPVIWTPPSKHDIYYSKSK